MSPHVSLPFMDTFVIQDTPPSIRRCIFWCSKLQAAWNRRLRARHCCRGGHCSLLEGHRCCVDAGGVVYISATWTLWPYKIGYGNYKGVKYFGESTSMTFKAPHCHLPINAALLHRADEVYCWITCWCAWIHRRQPFRRCESCAHVPRPLPITLAQHACIFNPPPYALCR